VLKTAIVLLLQQCNSSDLLKGLLTLSKALQSRATRTVKLLLLHQEWGGFVPSWSCRDLHIALTGSVPESPEIEKMPSELNRGDFAGFQALFRKLMISFSLLLSSEFHVPSKFYHFAQQELQMVTSPSQWKK